MCIRDSNMGMNMMPANMGMNMMPANMGMNMMPANMGMNGGNMGGMVNAMMPGNNNAGMKMKGMLFYVF